MSPEVDQSPHKSALEFARLVRDCIESFCLIHQGKKDWDRPQRVLMVKIGIEQARLLAWSQVMGVCELGEYRHAQLDSLPSSQQMRDTVEQMLARIVDETKDTGAQRYGLLPSKKARESLEVALDSTRLESFREQYMSLPGAIYASWDGATHWTINDNTKFEEYIKDTRGSIDTLVNLMDDVTRIDDCVKQDIKAMGWHPVFDQSRAALDGSRLRLIKDSCLQDYPQYSQATRVPIEYLNVQWSDSYQASIRAKYPISTMSEHQTSKLPTSVRKSKDGSAQHQAHQARKQSISGLISKFRPQSWHRLGSLTVPDTVPRSSSLSTATSPRGTEDNVDPERSKSDGDVSLTPYTPQVAFLDPFAPYDSPIASTVRHD